MLNVLPLQSVKFEVPVPINVELICSRIEVASMVCVLSTLLRLLVAIALTIKVSMLIEPITRIAPAIRVSTIVMPDSGFLTLSLSAVLSNLISN